MIDKGYTKQLRQHTELIEQLVAKYKNADNNRVNWQAALAAEPDLEEKLLVGEGSRVEKIRRLSNVWLSLRNGRGQGRQGLGQTHFKGEQSICSRLDNHRDKLEAMAKSAVNAMGRVSWLAALSANPDIADAIGYSTLSDEGRRKFVSVLGFWYRTRKKPGDAAPKELAPASQPAYVPAQAPAARFCPRCGEDLGAHTLACGIVASMSASGMTPEQITQTLTHAANTVAKLTA